MTEANYLAFTGLAALMTIAPGADMAIVTRSAISGGRRAAFVTSVGVCMGLFFHAVASAIGLSALISHSATAYNVVRYLGAGYLIFLGAQGLYRTWRKSEKPSVDTKAPNKQTSSEFAMFAQGMFNNVLNPKVAVFYLTFLPQVIDPAGNVLGQSLLLAATHLVMGLIWLGFYGAFVGRMSAFMSRPAIKRRIETITGAVLILFGLRLALEKR